MCSVTRLLHAAGPCTRPPHFAVTAWYGFRVASLRLLRKGQIMASRTPLRADVAQNLALAMVESSEVPLLLLDGDLRVIAASASFCRSFHVDRASVSDRLIFELGTGEWDVRQL